MTERDYTLGYRMALRQVLSHVLGLLGDEGSSERWRIERMDTVNILRQVCTDHGDNDWPDELYLADALEKHLWNHLEDLEKP